jgi:hypothetical protein
VVASLGMGHRGESALVRIQPTRSLPTIPRLPAAQANTPQSSTGAVSTGQGPGSGRHTLWRGWGLPCLYGCTLSASATPVLPLPAAPVSSCRPSSLCHVQTSAPPVPPQRGASNHHRMHTTGWCTESQCTAGYHPRAAPKSRTACCTRTHAGGREGDATPRGAV